MWICRGFFEGWNLESLRAVVDAGTPVRFCETGVIVSGQQLYPREYVGQGLAFETNCEVAGVRKSLLVEHIRVEVFGRPALFEEVEQGDVSFSNLDTRHSPLSDGTVGVEKQRDDDIAAVDAAVEAVPYFLFFQTSQFRRKVFHGVSNFPPPLLVFILVFPEQSLNGEPEGVGLGQRLEERSVGMSDYLDDVFPGRKPVHLFFRGELSTFHLRDGVILDTQRFGQEAQQVTSQRIEIFKKNRSLMSVKNK